LTSSAHRPLRKNSPNFFKVGKTTDKATGVFSIMDSLTLIELPVSIVVENGTSDGAFFSSIVRCFGSKELKRAENKQWLKIEHAGGKTNIPSEVRRRFIEPYDSAIASRKVFILFDSDKLHKDDVYRSKDNVEEILGMCNQNVLRYHCLFKRKIENYLSIGALKSLPGINGVNPAPYLDAYSRLALEARDYYDLRMGFLGKGEVPKSQKSIFPAEFRSGNPDFDLLRNGFKEILGELYFAFGDQTNVNANSFRSICKHHPANAQDELDFIICQISEML
jgi:hypothetical protein